MRILRVASLSLLLVLAAAWRESAGQQCGSSGVRLAFTSTQNASGHWTLDANVLREYGSSDKVTPLTAIVHPMVTNCGQKIVSQVHFILSGALPLPPPPSGGYELVHGLGYYKLHLEPTAWPEAKAACEAEGAHLLILNSQTEEAAIKAIVDRHPQAGIWFIVGFHDPHKTRNFVTIFGDPLASTGYTRWAQGQPDNAGNNEYCGCIHRSLGLNDLPCTMKVPFICELEI